MYLWAVITLDGNRSCVLLSILTMLLVRSSLQTLRYLVSTFVSILFAMIPASSHFSMPRTPP